MPGEVCSDRDGRYTHSTYPVVLLEPPSDNQQYQSGFVVAHGNPDQPAYLILQVTSESQIHKSLQGMIQGSMDTLKDVVNMLCSKEFVQSFVGKKQEIHGPAATGLAFKTHPKMGMIDFVKCLHCLNWPPCASGFLTRPRPHGWPSQSLIDKIQQAGCHAVGVGHPHSDNKDTEWRWSFSVAERELIHFLSTSMFECMYVLKAIKKLKWKNNAKENTPFCSYFIKTACLWNAELVPSHENSNIHLCIQTLDWLIECYKNKQLPHYFIPKQNLIGHLSNDLCKEAHDWLMDIRANIYQTILDASTNWRNWYDKLTNNIPYYGYKGLNYTSIKQALKYQRTHCQVLEDVANRITEDNQLYTDQRRLKWSGLFSFHRQWFLDQNVPGSELLVIPENLFLPIIENIHSVAMDGFGEVFTQSLYRYMADSYHALSAHLCEVDTSLSNACLDKSVHYYTMGREMVHPDGWSDKGLGGYALLAKLHYLTERNEELGDILDQIKPLLNQERQLPSYYAISSFSVIKLQPSDNVEIQPWKSDRLFYKHVITPCKSYTCRIDPVCLVYYIQARFYLSQGNTKEGKKAFNALIDIHLNMKEWPRKERHESARGMIRALASEIPMTHWERLRNGFPVWRFTMDGESY